VFDTAGQFTALSAGDASVSSSAGQAVLAGATDASMTAATGDSTVSSTNGQSTVFGDNGVNVDFISGTVALKHNGSSRIQMVSTGQLASNRGDYETLVTSDNVFPNKKYVDDKVAAVPDKYADLLDVDLFSLADGTVASYNASTSKFEQRSQLKIPTLSTNVEISTGGQFLATSGNDTEISSVNGNISLEAQNAMSLKTFTLGIDVTSGGPLILETTAAGAAGNAVLFSNHDLLLDGGNSTTVNTPGSLLKVASGNTVQIDADTATNALKITPTTITTEIPGYDLAMTNDSLTRKQYVDSAIAAGTNWRLGGNAEGAEVVGGTTDAQDVKIIRGGDDRLLLGPVVSSLGNGPSGNRIATVGSQVISYSDSAFACRTNDGTSLYFQSGPNSTAYFGDGGVTFNDGSLVPVTYMNAKPDLISCTATRIDGSPAVVFISNGGTMNFTSTKAINFNANGDATDQPLNDMFFKTTNQNINFIVNDPNFPGKQVRMDVQSAGSIRLRNAGSDRFTVSNTDISSWAAYTAPNDDSLLDKKYSDSNYWKRDGTNNTGGGDLIGGTNLGGQNVVLQRGNVKKIELAGGATSIGFDLTNTQAKMVIDSSKIQLFADNNVEMKRENGTTFATFLNPAGNDARIINTGKLSLTAASGVEIEAVASNPLFTINSSVINTNASHDPTGQNDGVVDVKYLEAYLPTFLASTNAHAQGYVSGNVASTTINVIGQYEQYGNNTESVLTLSNDKNFVLGAGNYGLTYTGTASKVFKVSSSYSLIRSVGGGGAADYTVAVFKNAIAIPGSEITVTNDSTTTLTSGASSTLVQLATNDVLTMHVKNLTDTNDVRFEEVTLTASAADNL
jgi:hypothetical protein